MLPFVRMIQYGNVVRTLSIVDIQVSRSHCLVLDSEGTLWGRGTNTSNILNNAGISTTSTFVVVDTGVSAMYCGYQFSVYVKNSVLYRIGISLTWEAGTVTVPTAISLPFSASSIKKIQCSTSASAMILLNDGTMWYKGAGTNGRFGNGSAAAVSVWTLSTKTNIKDMFHKFVSSEGSTAYSVLLLNDGTVWGAGSVRANGVAFGFGSYISTTTWIQRGATQFIQEFAAGSGGSMMYLDSSNNLYGDGNLNAELDGSLAKPTFINTLMASGVKLFGLNYESSYYVLIATPTVLNAGGRNVNLSSSFTSVGSYIGRANTDVGENIAKIYCPSTDNASATQYISLQLTNVVMGGSSLAYQLGVNTGNINLVKSTLSGIG